MPSSSARSCQSRAKGRRREAAEGTIRVATTRTGLKAYSRMLVAEREHVEALASALAAYGTSMRQANEQTDTCGDADRVLSAMRYEFSGHVERPTGG